MTAAIVSRGLPIVNDHFGRSVAAADLFFEAHADAVARACALMAARFDRGGSLMVFGSGAQASDAQHVAVEFVHPVIVGKRALPAVALTSDAALLTRDASGGSFAGSLQALGRDVDIALGISAGGRDEAVAGALARGRECGMLTMHLCADDDDSGAEVVFRVRDADPLVVQEVHETLYHVLWELVHVFFEHRAADDGGGDYEQQLYPFLFGSRGMADASAGMLHEVRSSTLQKARDVCDVRRAFLASEGARLALAAAEIAARVRQGARLLAFGNGGSATDAQDAVADCMAPPAAAWRRVPALALTNDVGVVTALGNDIGFEHVFARQVVAFGRPGDIALGFSTSGTARNVMRAFEEAKSRGLLTVGFSGHDGGEMARSAALDFCFTVRCDYVPRVQEAHATAWHAMLAAMHEELGR